MEGRNKGSIESRRNWVDRMCGGIVGWWGFWVKVMLS